MAALQDVKEMVTVTELDDLLQCPVCYEVPSGHIYQCNQGHHVCGDCKPRIDLCPVCRSMFFGTRNYAMEELISNIKKMKVAKIAQAVQTPGPQVDNGESSSSASSNTTLGTENNEARRHPAQCAGLFRCLCCSNAKKERFPVSRMLNHLRYWHSLDLIEGKLENHQYEQVWQIQMFPGRIVIAVRVVELGIFFFVVEIRSDDPMDLHAWLSMVASSVEAENYYYNLTLTGSDREATFSDTVMSVRSCEGQLKKRRRCLILDSVNMRAFFESQIISVRLCIKRGTDRDELRSEPRAALRIANLSLSDAGSTNSINSQDMLEARNIPVIASARRGQRPAEQPPSRVVPTVVQNVRSAPPQFGNAPPNNAIVQNRNTDRTSANGNFLPQQPNRNSNVLPARREFAISAFILGAGNAPRQPPVQNVAAAPVHNEAQLSRNARRRLRRRLNNVQAQLQQNRSPSPVIQQRAFQRPPVAPSVQQNGGQQAPANNRRPRARR